MPAIVITYPQLALEQFRINYVEDISNNTLGHCICTMYYNGLAKVMLIDSVEVRPDMRNQGIGMRIVEAAIKAARERCVDAIELVTGYDNIPAIGLYNKLGFVRSGKEQFRMILNKF